MNHFFRDEAALATAVATAITPDADVVKLFPGGRSGGGGQMGQTGSGDSFVFPSFVVANSPIYRCYGSPGTGLAPSPSEVQGSSLEASAPPLVYCSSEYYYT